jgi:hypothetical protein
MNSLITKNISIVLFGVIFIGSVFYYIVTTPIPKTRSPSETKEWLTREMNKIKMRGEFNIIYELRPVAKSTGAYTEKIFITNIKSEEVFNYFTLEANKNEWIKCDKEVSIDWNGIEYCKEDYVMGIFSNRKYENKYLLKIGWPKRN